MHINFSKMFSSSFLFCPFIQPGAVGGGSAQSDSEDSDIEDLHYVIQQSSTQLLQADSALRKPRRDVVQSGIYLDPQKYIEWHATCQTNIKCLQVCDTCAV
mgnify:FL=1